MLEKGYSFTITAEEVAGEYPAPEILPEPGVLTRNYEMLIGWRDRPYHVQVHCHEKDMWMSVNADYSKHRRLEAWNTGFIASIHTRKQARRVLRRHLRVAWRLNHDPEWVQRGG